MHRRFCRHRFLSGLQRVLHSERLGSPRLLASHLDRCICASCSQRSQRVRGKKREAHRRRRPPPPPL
eukprot:7586376-Alexandrium_andersonii.AAC.1